MEGVSLEGRLVPRLSCRVLRLLAGLTGLLVIKALVRFVGAYILGHRRPCVVSLDDSGIVVRAKTYLVGKVVRTSETRIPPWKIDRIKREERFRYAHVLVGALFFLLGVGVGFGFVVEWAWTRFGIYLLLGLGAVALGIALDAAVVFLVPAVRGRSALIVEAGRNRLRVEDVDDAEASRFMGRVEEFFRQRQGAKESSPSKRDTG